MRTIFVPLFVVPLAGAVGLLGLDGVAAQSSDKRTPEVVSPLGSKFFARPDAKGAVAQAEQKLVATPNDLEGLAALARAQVDVLRLRDAVNTYSRALKLTPEDPLLYRYRGHRYISLRRFDQAISDLERAARLNGQRFDIWYHLGLAYYLKGKFAEAAVAYEKAYQVSDKDDSRIAASDWLYMSHRRQGNDLAARRALERITPDMKVAEDQMYFDRLLFYKGLKKESEIFHARLDERQKATMGYGIGNWHLYNGNHSRAKEIFESVLTSKEWAAFGFIASEKELAHWPPPGPAPAVR
jgi:tetratricopeptide (TPR) repeat protein